MVPGPWLLQLGITKDDREASHLPIPPSSLTLWPEPNLGINDLLFGVYSCLHLSVVLLQFLFHRHQPVTRDRGSQVRQKDEMRGGPSTVPITDMAELLCLDINSPHPALLPVPVHFQGTRNAMSQDL